MLLNKVLLGLLPLSVVLAYPAMDRRDDAGLILARATNAPSKSSADNSPKTCKKAADCSCPKRPDGSQYSSCIFGTCSCENPFASFTPNGIAKPGEAASNSPVNQALANEVGAALAGALFGPGAKAALKHEMDKKQGTVSSRELLERSWEDQYEELWA